MTGKLCGNVRHVLKRWWRGSTANVFELKGIKVLRAPFLDLSYLRALIKFTKTHIISCICSTTYSYPSELISKVIIFRGKVKQLVLKKPDLCIQTFRIHIKVVPVNRRLGGICKNLSKHLSFVNRSIVILFTELSESTAVAHSETQLRSRSTRAEMSRFIPFYKAVPGSWNTEGSVSEWRRVIWIGSSRLNLWIARDLPWVWWDLDNKNDTEAQKHTHTLQELQRNTHRLVLSWV